MNNEELRNILMKTLDDLLILKESKLSLLETKQQELEEKIRYCQNKSNLLRLLSGATVLSSVGLYLNDNKSQAIFILGTLSIATLINLGILIFNQENKSVCQVERDALSNDLEELQGLIDPLWCYAEEDPEIGSQSKTSQASSSQTLVRTRKRTTIEEENIIIQNTENCTR